MPRSVSEKHARPAVEAADRIGDPQHRPHEPRGLDALVEHLPGRAHERHAERFLVAAWLLTDQHDFRIRITRTFDTPIPAAVVDRVTRPAGATPIERLREYRPRVRRRRHN